MKDIYLAKPFGANVSVSSNPDDPLGDTRGFARSHCQGGRDFAKFSAVLKEN